MPTQQKEEIGVILQGIVNSLSLRAERTRIPVIDHMMGNNDGSAIAVGLKQSIRPGQNSWVGRWVIL